ncbi:MAG TPA: 2-amino-4-hydroxy-6-hydroxymethyldihydropteridine diphosphokinase [Kofleriaceae bacterium]|nr:2-amino-4-hydroxy-6-hydroxymethyldihydropteridine diphosphokinase [Kofleriaceae bacterium]
MTELDPETVVLGLGGNVGGDAAILARFAAAVRALEAWSTARASRVFRTAALGPEQPDYLNAAVAVDVPEELTASELIREVQGIERSLGRDRGAESRWGPRPIDLDVLLWGTRRITFRGPPALEVPHPRLAERAFALVPAIDVTGADLVHPVLKRTLGELRAAVADQRVDVTALHIDGAPPSPHLLDG